MTSVLESRPPRLGVADAVRIAAEQLGLEGATARDLGSERDKTFLVEAEGDSVVLKVSNSGEAAASLDFEAEAIFHIARVDPELPVARPRAISAEPGAAAYRATVDGPEGERHFVRAFERLEGSAEHGQLSDAALADFGRTNARLNRALRGFFHPAAGRHLLWDLAHCAELRPWVEAIIDERRRALVTAVLDRYEARVAPAWPRLRAQVVHGDLSFENLLFDEAGRVSGIVDFGDASHTAQVADLAISLLSVVRDRPHEEVFRVARLTLDGYSSLMPLEPEELALLGDLLCARLATTVVISAWRAERFPENTEYVSSWDDDCWRLLELAVEKVGFERFGEELGAARPLAATAELAERRERSLGPAIVPLTYAEPVHLVSGEGVWLHDSGGRRLLDAYNNVPVVGHCHPRVSEAVVRQTRALNTHSRYLYEPLVELAERLLSSMPAAAGLDCVVLVNSGSEANDVAWRIATGATGHRGAVVTRLAYHGVTALSADLLSPEEWPPGYEAAGVERVAPGFDAVELAAAAERLAAGGFGLAATYLDLGCTSDGVLPVEPERLQGIVEATHAGGGLFVADEVQVGFGRDGRGLWSFAGRGVAPDFVTLGKPMGNGYPVAALLTRGELVERSGLAGRIFSTFGGNPVAARAALAVLDVIEDERLVAHVDEIAPRLVAGVEELRDRHPEIVAVRNLGLLVGVELDSPERAGRAVEHLCTDGVLVGSTGPDGAVLKIRPPLVFGDEHAELLLAALGRALAED